MKTSEGLVDMNADRLGTTAEFIQKLPSVGNAVSPLHLAESRARVGVDTASLRGAKKAKSAIGTFQFVEVQRNSRATSHVVKRLAMLSDESRVGSIVGLQRHTAVTSHAKSVVLLSDESRVGSIVENGSSVSRHLQRKAQERSQ
jgi:hypothetical protein